jgi:anti-anti-sigma factor
VAPLDNLTVTPSDSDPNSLAVDGQIDSHTSGMLDEAITAFGANDEIIVDLAGVTFIDSSGLRVLVRAHKRQRDSGGRFVIASPSEAVRRLLEITGLTSELAIRR